MDNHIQINNKNIDLNAFDVNLSPKYYRIFVESSQEMIDENNVKDIIKQLLLKIKARQEQQKNG